VIVDYARFLNAEPLITEANGLVQSPFA
jgi:hypothetical protein